MNSLTAIVSMNLSRTEAGRAAETAAVTRADDSTQPRSNTVQVETDVDSIPGYF